MFYFTKKILCFLFIFYNLVLLGGDQQPDMEKYARVSIYLDQDPRSAEEINVMSQDLDLSTKRTKKARNTRTKIFLNSWVNHSIVKVKMLELKDKYGLQMFSSTSTLNSSFKGIVEEVVDSIRESGNLNFTQEEFVNALVQALGDRCKKAEAEARSSIIVRNSTAHINIQKDLKGRQIIDNGKDVICVLNTAQEALVIEAETLESIDENTEAIKQLLSYNYDDRIDFLIEEDSNPEEQRGVKRKLCSRDDVNVTDEKSVRCKLGANYYRQKVTIGVNEITTTSRATTRSSIRNNTLAVVGAIGVYALYSYLSSGGLEAVLEAVEAEVAKPALRFTVPEWVASMLR